MRSLLLAVAVVGTAHATALAVAFHRAELPVSTSTVHVVSTAPAMARFDGGRDAAQANPPHAAAPPITRAPTERPVRTDEGAASAPAGATAYYGFDQVDTAARPVSTWWLATANTGLAQSPWMRLVVTIWVSADGAIERWQWAETPPPGADAMMEAFGDTPMQPALRQGRAVASLRTVEIAVSRIDGVAMP